MSWDCLTPKTYDFTHKWSWFYTKSITSLLIMKEVSHHYRYVGGYLAAILDFYYNVITQKACKWCHEIAWNYVITDIHVGIGWPSWILIIMWSLDNLCNWFHENAWPPKHMIWQQNHYHRVEIEGSYYSLWVYGYLAAIFDFWVKIMPSCQAKKAAISARDMGSFFSSKRSIDVKSIVKPWLPENVHRIGIYIWLLSFMFCFYCNLFVF